MHCSTEQHYPRLFVQLLAALSIVCLAAQLAVADPPSTLAAVPAGYDDVAQPFIKQYCVSCHGETAKAGFRIDRLGVDFSAAAVADHWKELTDRINMGEMPPQESPQPSAKEVASFVTWVNAQLRQVELAAKQAGGRIPMRRLNRDEYANTIRDLLLLDERIVRPLIEDLPTDGQAEGFDRLGVALFFDQTQIERSLGAAEKLVARAIVTAPPKENNLLQRFDFYRKRPPADMVEVFPGFKHTIPRGAKDRFIHPEHIEIIQGGPTYKREYDGWGAIEHFAISQIVTQDGFYRFRVKATVDNRDRKEANKFRLQYATDSPIFVEQEVAVDPSGTTDVVLFLRGPVNGEVKGPQVFRLLWNHTEKAVITEPVYMKLFSQWTALRGKTEQAVTRRAPQLELDDLKKQRDELEKQLNAWTGVSKIYNPEMDVEKLPRLLLESIEVTGPVQKEWPPTSHQQFFSAGDERQDANYVREIFTKFLPRAYRRPVTTAEVEAIVAVVIDAQTTSKLPFKEAMRIGLQRVLCSPNFHFLHEPSAGENTRRALNNYELASRLSYFLWSSMPDEELFTLAAQGKLQEPAVVQTQLRRMLADPKAEQFVRNFGGQWLSVRDYSSVQPAAEYRDYDKPLEAAARQEPFAFFSEVLTQNLPITSFLDSDFLVINERLAKHYGIADVVGPEFRRVPITPEHHRGGVLGMAGLMTFLADGTRTLPMRRGSWVLRELFNDPPNSPPPNAGEIQPNTAGKSLTVRQRLELHRSNDVCASCHAKLDPYGLALENYDAIGKWRERFNGEGFRGTQGPLLDVSGELPGGQKFATLEEYKTLLLQQKDRFARAFTSKMLTYALSRPVGYADHEVVDSLTAALKKDDYRIQSLVRGIVASEPFLTK